MSLLAIAARGTAALSNVTFRSHHRGGHGSRPAPENLAGIGQPGQLPVGVGAGLISGVAQALQKSISGRPPAGPASASASLGTTPTATAGTYRPGLIGTSINIKA